MIKRLGKQKKYEFTCETMEFQGHTLRRILYVSHGKHFNNGEFGGWIESEHNLSHEGECLVKDDAKVFGHAQVMDNAAVGNNAVVKDNAQVKGDAMVLGDSIVGADTIVSGFSWIQGKSNVFFYADDNYGTDNISGDTRIKGTVIESTGFIRNAYIVNQKLDGELQISNDTLVD